MLRVGAPPYLVAQPLTIGLEDEPGIRFEQAPPSRLIERLRARELDVALVSSIELFRQDGYGYLDGPAVAARGEIASVRVFLRRPLRELRRIALDPSSRTAQALVQIVLPARVGKPHHELEFVEGGAADASADAWLEIGDPALVRALSPGAPPSFDPAQAWCEDTALPFVFALWIVRPGLTPSGEQIARLEAARRRGQEDMEALVSRAASAWRLPVDACRRYLTRECSYEPRGELAAALEEFRARAAVLDLCQKDCRPRVIPWEPAPCRA